MCKKGDKLGFRVKDRRSLRVNVVRVRASFLVVYDSH